MMTEAQAVGEKLGVAFKIALEQRIAGAEAVGAHKTSMLQDVEHGRPIELDALVTVVQELGRLTDRRRRPSTPCSPSCAGWPSSAAATRPDRPADRRLLVAEPYSMPAAGASSPSAASGVTSSTAACMMIFAAPSAQSFMQGSPLSA